MAEMESRRGIGFWKRLGWQLPALGVVLLLTCLYWLRTQPERLINDSSGTIYGDNVYSVRIAYAPGQKDTSILVQSIHGGARRTLVPDDPRCEFYQDYSHFSTKNFNIADGEMYYIVQTRTPIPPTTGRSVAGAVVAIGGTSLGTFLPPLQSPPVSAASAEKRYRVPPSLLPTKEAQFRQVSLQGGNPQEKVKLLGEGYCLVGSYVFWIRPGKDQVVEVQRGRSARNSPSWLEVTAHSDLMLTSLVDGTTRCIRSGIPRNTSLSAGEAGVLFREPAPFPGAPKLIYARASDGSVHSLGAVEQNQAFLSSLEFEGRLYWTVDIQGPMMGNSLSQKLMSANLDGTDRREVLTELEKQELQALSIKEYRGSLYCCFDQLSANYLDRAKAFLCRLHPERADPLEILRKLPAGTEARTCSFDGGYLYFEQMDGKRNLWTALTAPDMPPKFTPTLCRVPLDH